MREIPGESGRVNVNQPLWLTSLGAHASIIFAILPTFRQSSSSATLGLPQRI
jgi:hypothetical protein